MFPNKTTGTFNDDHPELHRHLIGGWRFKTLLITVILSIIGYFLFSLWAGWDNVVKALYRTGILGIAFALCLSLLNFFFRFLRWHFFLATLGYKVPFGASLRIFLSGFSLTTTPGKSGEAIKGIFLKDYGVPFRISLGAFFAERFYDLLSVTLLAASGLWIYAVARPILLVVVIVLGIIIYVVQNEKLLQAIERKIKKILPQRFSRGIEFLLEIALSFRSCFTPRVMLPALLLGVAAWTSEGIALYGLLQLLGYNIDLITAIFIYAFSLVIGGITLLPGGLGGAELTMLQLLRMQNVEDSVAVAVTLVIRLTSLWFSVFLGLICLPKKQILLK